MPAEFPPLPPQRPDDHACCESGCSPCVWDLYREELEQYADALAQWRARQPSPPESDR